MKSVTFSLLNLVNPSISFISSFDGLCCTEQFNSTLSSLLVFHCCFESCVV